MSATINEVRNAVITSLQGLFPEIPVYGENVAESAPQPYFLVELSEVEHFRERDGRYFRSHAFDVQYFSDTNEDRHSVAETLYEGLETVEIDGHPCRGSHMRHEIFDGVLHFYVRYEFSLFKPKPEASPMGAMEQKGAVKA